ncbi:hydantoinase B/oxoprolinase family protein [Paraglaciecola marina]|uniref:hydantoinase B/oxoprolinase family protein n=1 Tax=Paraglaciecola marina TaxID=2500157 RepID=UPI00105C6F95|nr:hydantoinase B/oxoprolinase family protein [Paraglaciecola marina]
MMNKSIDPITTEIIQSSMKAITDEMFVTMRKTAMSSVIYEVLDFGVAMFDANGQLASSGSGIPGFIGMLEPGVQSVMEKFDETMIAPGDIFITNIPHKGGVSHLNDVVLILPVFYQSKRIGWLANKAHWVDVGGSFPGSISAEATEIYQEGLQLPCVKVIAKGELNQAVLDIMMINSRQPETTQGDFWAGVASMRAGEKRFLNLAKKYGVDALDFAIADYIELAEKISRNALAKLPAGTYQANEVTDDGLDIKATVTITPEEFIVDLTGNPPQQANALNASYDATMVDLQMIFKAIASPQTFANAGSFKPIKLLVDDNSMFAAKYPSAMSVYYETSIMLFDLIWKALAPAIPESLTAGHYASICGTFLGGPHPDTGLPLSIVEPQIGGWGASRSRDGVNALYTGYHGDTFNVPAEVTEQRNGIMIERLELNDEPGGEGEFIGGKGIKLYYRILADNWWITMAYVRSCVGPWGLDGGLRGSHNYINVVKKDGKKTRYRICTALQLNKGDVIEVFTANGGGYGKPENRSLDAIQNDLKNGYITPERAKEIYKV